MRMTPVPLISFNFLALVLACGPIVVGDKDKPRPEYEPYSSREEVDSFSAEDWFTDFQRTNEDEASILIQKIREGLRKKLRDGLSQVEENLQSPVPIQPILNELPATEHRRPEDALNEIAKNLLQDWLIFLQSERYFLLPTDWLHLDQVHFELDKAIVGLFFDFGIRS
ncbi:MAG: hypothetical protein ACOH5I_14130 [Oligoflexus sp.]